ncbi:uncharacterized protein SPPG_05402 [Spizellomyces punctatus DAOM BR117]|uniref:Enoyl reductase (ER) domain-containing protein n=1 Tax=Spizellomyces punctatus (strain DAOM BR117) TaxID=645134 RepID=A0A0L0HDU6_SPIPD|nr:uncharacterized protein SPPG_05402 [Spizellomyces punctatus DAOM BR117]KNC99144.1 hypothetical protein SPPG_05402 [Spizellomyces punctatus DAOM BR117]|eukprot:XP_016607184.1 hypothetical protein SPPG_05402 [Spizellomyces punctatus DAOM BR117]
MPKAVLAKQVGSLSDNIYVGDVEKPTPGPGQVVIKVHSAAINPIDWKIVKSGFMVSSWPSQLGIDLSGTIDSLGPNTEESGFKPGDQVFGSSILQAFSEYALADANNIHKKPSNLSFDEAATLGTGLNTTIVGLFSETSGLGLARPQENRRWFVPEWVLVWGGATSMGAYAVQLAAAAGYSVVATASPKNAEYVQSLGAVQVFDYNAPDTVAKIREQTGNRLRLAFDAIGGEIPGQIVETLVANPEFPSTIVSLLQKADSLTLPDGVNFKAVFGAAPETVEFVSGVIDEVLGYIQEGRIRPNRVKVIDGGLEGVKEALELSAAGKVSAEKLVVQVSA